jgi:F-type H+-transporting ATPase subunit b
VSRRFFALLLLLVVGLTAFAAEQAPPADAVAHGAEKEAHKEAHPGEAHGGHTEQPKFLGLPFWIWKLVNMLLFFGLLFYLLGGPMKRAFAARGEQIRNTAAEAKERSAKADQMASDIQARLSRLEGEVQAIHERAQAEGERQKRELIAAAETEAQKILQNAQSEVDNRLRYARQELTEYAGQLAAERAEQLLKDKMTDEDRRKLFRESLTEVEGARS